MAGAGYKLFNTGDVLTAAQVNTYLQEQTVMVFASAAARTTALSGVLAEGMMSYLSDTDLIQYYNGTSWTTVNTDQTPLTTKGDLFTYSTADARLGVGSAGQVLTADPAETTGLKWNAPVASLANPIINGGFDIWQRGTSFANVATTTTYCADRFQYYANTTANNYTISRQTVSDATNLPNLQYAMRVQRDSGKTTTGILYMSTPLETVNSIPFAGKTVTFSFYARAGANFSAPSSALSVILDSGTGTDQTPISGYTGSSYVINGTATLTTTWQRFAFTGTVGTGVKEIGTSMFYTPVGTAGANDWFEMTGLQIDLGTYTASTAPTFRRSGGTLAGELAACQRYYFRTSGSSAYSALALGMTTSATAALGLLSFPVSMRTTPSTFDNGSLYVEASGSSSSTSSTVAYANATVNTVRLNITGMSGLTANQPAIIYTNNSSTSYIAASAEL